MADNSGIEWTEATWNPVRGCQKVSPGCKYCYAETFAERWRGVAGNAYEQGFDPRLAPELLDAPLRWRRPRRIFVNSMSDLFGSFVPDGYIADVWRVMGTAGQHTFQVLTKRADRLRDWMARWADTQEPANDTTPKMARGPAAVRAAHTAGRAHLFAEMLDRWGEPPDGAAFPSYDWMEGMRWWPDTLPNVWLGVSVENRQYGLPRIELLRQVPAALRFLSLEPLLEDLGELDLRGIGWVIVGGESDLLGRARACHLAWIRSIAAQCRAQRVPLFVKQAGAKPVEGGRLVSIRSRKGGNLLDLPEDLRVREYPGVEDLLRAVDTEAGIGSAS